MLLIRAQLQFLCIWGCSLNEISIAQTVVAIPVVLFESQSNNPTYPEQLHLPERRLIAVVHCPYEVNSPPPSIYVR